MKSSPSLLVAAGTKLVGVGWFWPLDSPTVFARASAKSAARQRSVGTVERFCPAAGERLRVRSGIGVYLREHIRHWLRVWELCCLCGAARGGAERDTRALRADTLGGALPRTPAGWAGPKVQLSSLALGEQRRDVVLVADGSGGFLVEDRRVVAGHRVQGRDLWPSCLTFGVGDGGKLVPQVGAGVEERLEPMGVASGFAEIPDGGIGLLPPHGYGGEAVSGDVGHYGILLAVRSPRVGAARRVAGRGGLRWQLGRSGHF